MPNPAKRDTLCVFPKTIVLVFHELVSFWRFKSHYEEGVSDGEMSWRESRSPKVPGRNDRSQKQGFFPS